MQTITTQFKGPTNHKGSRILVKSWLKNKTFNWDCKQSPEQNHDKAAQNLVDIINAERDEGDYAWRIIGGGSLPDGRGNAYIVGLFRVDE